MIVSLILRAPIIMGMWLIVPSAWRVPTMRSTSLSAALLWWGPGGFSEFQTVSLFRVGLICILSMGFRQLTLPGSFKVVLVMVVLSIWVRWPWRVMLFWISVTPSSWKCIQGCQPRHTGVYFFFILLYFPVHSLPIRSSLVLFYFSSRVLLIFGLVLYFRSFKSASYALHEVWRGWWIAYVTPYIRSLHAIYGERLPTLFKLNTYFGLWILYLVSYVLCLMYRWQAIVPGGRRTSILGALHWHPSPSQETLRGEPGDPGKVLKLG